MAENNTEIMRKANPDTETVSIIANTDNARWASFLPETKADKVALYNAFNNPDVKIADIINQPIDVVDVVLAQVNLVDDKTGEVDSAVRTILIDKEGKTYDATSSGIYNSILTINAVFGSLHYTADEPLTVVVKQIKTKRGSTLTLAVL